MSNITQLSESVIREFPKLREGKGAQASEALAQLAAILSEGAETCFGPGDNSTAHASFLLISQKISEMQQRLDESYNRIDALIERIDNDILTAEDSLSSGILED